MDGIKDREIVIFLLIIKCVIWKGDLDNFLALDLIPTIFKPSKQAT